MGCWRKASRRWLDGCAALLALVFASLVVIGVPQVAVSPDTQSAGTAFAHAAANSVVAAGATEHEREALPAGAREDILGAVGDAADGCRRSRSHTKLRMSSLVDEEHAAPACRCTASAPG